MRIPSILFVTILCAKAVLGAQPIPEPPSAESPPASDDSTLRLDRLHDPGSTIYLRFRIEPWANSLIGSPLPRLWSELRFQGPIDRFQNLVEPRALAIARLLFHPGVSQAAYAAWPPAPIGRIERPRWMLGVASDFEGETGRLLDRFFEWSDLAVDTIEETPAGNRSILSAGGVHVVAGNNRLVFSSHLSLLQEFLQRQPTNEPIPDWPEADAEGFWRVPPPIHKGSSGWGSGFGFLRSLGISEIHYSCRTLSPGLEVRFDAIGISRTSLPHLEPTLDFELLQEAPTGSDLLLVGGAIPVSATTERSLEEPWSRFAKGFGSPFALGVDVPSATSGPEARLQIGGMVRKPPPGEAFSSPFAEYLSEQDSPPPQSAIRQWGELPIEVKESRDFVRFSNADTKIGDLPNEIPLQNDEVPRNPRSLAIAFLSPELLARPYDDYRLSGGEGNPPKRDLAALWGLTRPFVQPLEISLNLEPGALFEITAVSKSVLSPFLFLAALPAYGEILFPSPPVEPQDSP